MPKQRYRRNPVSTYFPQIEYSFLCQCSSEFKQWNEHTPSRLCSTLYVAISCDNILEAKVIALSLVPYMTLYASGDEQGRYWYASFVSLLDSLSTIQIPVQLELF